MLICLYCHDSFKAKLITDLLWKFSSWHIENKIFIDTKAMDFAFKPGATKRALCDWNTQLYQR